MKYAPRLYYTCVGYRAVTLDIIAPQIALGDLNEAVQSDTAAIVPEDDRPSAVNFPYGAPKRMFQLVPKHSKASGIWALGCCFFDMRSSTQLIRGSSDPVCYHQSVQRLVGPLPQQWIEKIRSQPEHSEQSILQPHDFSHNDETLHAKLNATGDWLPWHRMSMRERYDWLVSEWRETRDFSDPNLKYQIDTGPPPPAKLSDDEFADFHDLLSKMLRYLPEERLTIEEVMQHAWLHKTYTDHDPPAEWLSRFEWGQDTRPREAVVYEDDEFEQWKQSMIAQGKWDAPESDNEEDEGKDRKEIESNDASSVESPSDDAISVSSQIDYEGEISHDALEYQDASDSAEMLFVTKLLGLPTGHSG